jgi:hypothetical protein
VREPPGGLSWTTSRRQGYYTDPHFHLDIDEPHEDAAAVMLKAQVITAVRARYEKYVSDAR